MTMVCPVCKRGNGAWIGCHNAACTDGRNLIPVSPAVADLAEARAEIERLNNALTEAVNQISDLSTRLGQAEGRLEASEMAGVVEGWRDRALKAEATVAAAFEAADPYFIWGALDNVHDADTTLDDYAAAVSRAIRAIIPAHAQAALEAYGREKVLEGMRRAADLCKPKKSKMDWGGRWTPARKNQQSAAAQSARKQCHDAILAAMEKEGGE